MWLTQTHNISQRKSFCFSLFFCEFKALCVCVSVTESQLKYLICLFKPPKQWILSEQPFSSLSKRAYVWETSKTLFGSPLRMVYVMGSLSRSVACKWEKAFLCYTNSIMMRKPPNFVIRKHKNRLYLGSWNIWMYIIYCIFYWNVFIYLNL